MGELEEKGLPASQAGCSPREMDEKNRRESLDHVSLDPRVIKAGFDITGYYIETGRKSFAEYAQKMIEEYGYDVRPYLRSWYLAVRYYPGVDATGMDSASRVDELMAFEDSCT